MLSGIDVMQKIYQLGYHVYLVLAVILHLASVHNYSIKGIIDQVCQGI